MFFTDSGEYPLMDVRRIAFAARADEVEAKAETGEALG
jgi:hypothetical protein